MTAGSRPGSRSEVLPSTISTPLILQLWRSSCSPSWTSARSGARLIWTLLNLAAFLAGLGWILKGLGMRGAWAAGFLALALICQPVYSGLGQGQAYLLLFGVLVVAWHGFRSGRPALLGVALGLMLTFKIAGLFLLLLLLARRQWSALGWAVATTVVVGVASLPWLGTQGWLTYLSLLPGFNGRPDLSVTAYQSLPGLFRHLFTYDPQWNPSPALEAPMVAAVLTIGCVGSIAGLSCYLASRDRENRDLVFSAFVLANLVLSPLSLEYHFPFALLPLAVVLARVSVRPVLLPFLLLGVAAALLALDLPYLSARLESGVWSLLAYPRLWGALVLWGLVLWVIGRGVMVGPAALPQQHHGEEGARHSGQQSCGHRPGGAERRY